MRIIIEYEASWRNSFLDGSNNEKIPDKGRNYIGSMTALKTEGNFKRHEVTKDTVMGILNRLIGDQRKLYQARESENYYFAQLESKLLPEHIIDRPNKLVTSQEMIYLRNMSGNTDPSSFSGLIKSNNEMLNSNYSKELWQIIYLKPQELIKFIVTNQLPILQNIEVVNTEPLIVASQCESIKKISMKSLESDFNLDLDDIKNAVNILLANNSKLEVYFTSSRTKFSDVEYFNEKQINLPALYFSALYLQGIRLKEKGKASKLILKGFSVKNFTKKDFMKFCATGGDKLLWGNPFLLKVKKKGEGEVTSMLTKASGELEINLPLDKAEADDLKQKIENAGVSSFYLGKKGLAFVKEIR